MKAKTQTVFALVSPEDYEALAGFKWHMSGAYACRYTSAGEKLRMHRELLGLRPGDTLEGDHINRDKLDNRRENLRAVTHGENMLNTSAQGGVSRYRGVSWDQRGRYWYSQAQIRGKRSHLGTFRNERDAARAVNAFWVAHGVPAPNDLNS